MIYMLCARRDVDYLDVAAEVFQIRLMQQFKQTVKEVEDFLFIIEVHIKMIYEVNKYRENGGRL